MNEEEREKRGWRTMGGGKARYGRYEGNVFWRRARAGGGIQPREGILCLLSTDSDRPFRRSTFPLLVNPDSKRMYTNQNT